MNTNILAASVVAFLGATFIGADLICRGQPWHGWGVILVGFLAATMILGNGVRVGGSK